MDKEITNKILLDMLGNVLVEMRSHTNPDYAKTMSDIFHNVPARIVKNISPMAIYEDMERAAKRHNVEGYLEKLLDHSMRKAI